jgi:hypothetical protein
MLKKPDILVEFLRYYPDFPPYINDELGKEILNNFDQWQNKI